MRGLGTIINALAILAGGVLGILCKSFLKARYQDTIIKATGFAVVFLGAAGPELLAECRALHGCRTGKAKITKGYRLKAKYIIHTVGPIYSGTAQDAELLADCYHNSLDLAKEYAIHSIAFPAISTGVYGYPLEDATKIAVNTVAQWLETHPEAEIQVIFCCFDARTEGVYRAKL